MRKLGLGRILRRLVVVPAALGWVLASVAVTTASAAVVCQGWTGTQPPADSSGLDSVSVVSACDVWAASGNGLLLHWTGGGGWTQVSGVRAYEITALSASNVWAISDSGFVHWDGASWTPVPGADLGPGASFVTLDSLSAVSATDVWAVGYYTSASATLPLAEHWDGTGWRQVSAASLGQITQLVSVSAVSATDAWAVGAAAGGVHSGLLAHWDGATWRLATTADLGPGVHRTLWSVSAVSPASAWAVGSYEPPGEPQHNLIEHWDGTAWTQVPAPVLGGTCILFSVSAMSAHSVWAAGWCASSFPGDITPRVLHWDGSAWTVVAGAAPGVGMPEAVSAGPDGTAWVTGFGPVPTSRGAAAPVAGVPAAEFAVNALGRNLRETGLVNGPAGNLSVAAATGPSVAISSSGAFMTAWTAANGHLWTVDSAGHRTDRMRLVATGSSPGIAALAGGGYETAFAGASDGSLWLMAPDGTFAQAAGAVAIAAGTSPAITALAGGGFAVAVRSAATGHLLTIAGGTVHDTGVGMAAGTSPALAPLAGGGFEAAVHAADSGHLVTIDPGGAVQDSGIDLAKGTSPAVAVAPAGGYEAAGHANNTDHLVTVTSDGSVQDTGLTLAADTSPAITVLPDGSYQLAYAAKAAGNENGDLTTITGTGGGGIDAGAQIDTGIAMTAATAPDVAAVAPPPPSTIAVPDVLSIDQPTATHILVSAGLTIGTISQDFRCIDVAGAVLLQDPNSGAQVPPGTPVHLTVSAGTDANGNPCTFQ